MVLQYFSFGNYYQSHLRFSVFIIDEYFFVQMLIHIHMSHQKQLFHWKIAFREKTVGYSYSYNAPWYYGFLLN